MDSYNKLASSKINNGWAKRAGSKKPLLVRHQYHPLWPSKCKGLHGTLRRFKLLVRVQVGALVSFVPVAQLDRASDYESEGWKFDSSWERFRASGGTVYAGEASLSTVEVSKIIHADDEKDNCCWFESNLAHSCSCGIIGCAFAF